jgi:hypothetical protein
VSLQQILSYITIKKKNTKQYHNYYIQSRHKLFSNPLLLDNYKTKEGKDILDLKSLRHDLTEYVKGYSVYVENTIYLKVNIKSNEFMGLSFDKQIFHQIIFSITCNILHFIKNVSDTNIEITFSNHSVQFRYNKSFPINKDILIINSDPVILNELSEPFILGFSNIFNMLENLGMEYVVQHKNNFNIIEILLNKSKKQKPQVEVSNIIDISKIINKKRNNDI